MKKKYLLLLFLIIPIWMFIYSCMDDPINYFPPRSDKEEVLSVKEAWKYFEDYMTESVSTRTGHECGEDCSHNRDYPLLTEFTPQWEKAVTSNCDKLASVDVPVFSAKKYIVFEEQWEGDEFRGIRVIDVLQKLIVVKNPETGNHGVYHAYIIPDVSYIEKHRKINFDNFFNSGDKKDFSGKIIYMLPDRPVPARVSIYKEGQYIDGAFRFGEKETRLENHKKILTLMRKIQIVPMQAILRTKTDETTELDEVVIEDTICAICKKSDCVSNNHCPHCYMLMEDCICMDFPFPDEEPDIPGGFGEDSETPEDPNPGDNGDYPPDPKPEPEPKPKPKPKPEQQPALAMKIFRNSRMSLDNWMALEAMIKKMILDCLGEALYNGLVDLLDGKTLIFEFDLFRNSSSFRYGASAGITLNNFESNTLLHEMFHAYQAYMEPPGSARNSFLNHEIEARFAQYMYVKKLPEFQAGSKWYNRYYKTVNGESIRKLEEYMDKNGNYIEGATDFDLDIHVINICILSLPDSYSAMMFNYDRTGLENFKNFKILSKDC